MADVSDSTALDMPFPTENHRPNQRLLNAFAFGSMAIPSGLTIRFGFRFWIGADEHGLGPHNLAVFIRKLLPFPSL